MSFIIVRRAFVLILFIVSMLGPWTFDLIHVPAQYTCDMPFVRLYDDFCGSPLSGYETMKWAAGGLIGILDDLMKGASAGRIPELIFLVCALIIVLPFFSTLLLIRNQSSRQLQITNLIVWGLACLPALTMLIIQTNRGEFARFFYLLWGLWLYILLAIGTILFELLLLRSNNKPGMDIQTTSATVT